MGKEWDKNRQWRIWIEEEQTIIYSLAYFLTANRETAMRWIKQAVTLAYQSNQVVSRVLFLKVVTDHLCHFYLARPKEEGRELASILHTLFGQERETRLLVLFYCLLRFDRETLAKKLEWPQEKLNYQLNLALRKLRDGFLT